MLVIWIGGMCEGEERSDELKGFRRQCVIAGKVMSLRSSRHFATVSPA